MIDKFIDYLELEKNYSRHTIISYRRDLESFQEFCVKEFNSDCIDDKHYNEIRSWIVSLVNSGISNRSINRKVSSLKSFYKFLRKVGVVKENPLIKHKALKVQKKIQIPFSVKEVEDVISLFEGAVSFIELRDKLIVELFYSTGIRCSELVGLKETDFNLFDHTVLVTGKRNKQRKLPLFNSVLETLEAYRRIKEVSFADSDFLFVTQKGVKIYETLVYRVINSYFSKVSKKVKKSPHIIRHSFATHLLNQGADLNSVKELLGHSSLASTQVYTHNSIAALKKVFNHAHPREQRKKKR